MNGHANGVNDGVKDEEEQIVEIPEAPVGDGDDTDEANAVPNEHDEPRTPADHHQQPLLGAWDFFNHYDFPILLLAFIGIAKLAPEFGAVHLAPQYTAKWIAVALIFCKLIFWLLLLLLLHVGET
jgi:hypothetical protein